MMKKPILTIALLMPGLLFARAQKATYTTEQGKEKRIEYADGFVAEKAFFSGNYELANYIFSTLAQNQTDAAFCYNQLGSIALTEHDNAAALKWLTASFYAMNNIGSYAEEEQQAIKTSGKEQSKAYKGDPYEKSMNALYVALLLYQKGDLENALAAVKTGILADSDVNGALYKSDFTGLYLLGARLSKKLNKPQLSKQYMTRAQEAYKLNRPEMRPLISDLSLLLAQKREKEEELNAMYAKYSKKKKLPRKGRKIEADLKPQVENLRSLIQQKEATKLASLKAIDTSALLRFLDIDNNVMLVCEIGQAPVKYRSGQYGKLALLAGKHSPIHDLTVTEQTQTIACENHYFCNDLHYQSTTRGGRKMDAILEGQAQFKESMSNTSKSLANSSQEILRQTSGFASSSPEAAAVGAAAAGVMAIGSAIFSGISASANPEADVRHWSLMPAMLICAPLHLDEGDHALKARWVTADGSFAGETNFDITVRPDMDAVTFIQNRD